MEIPREKIANTITEYRDQFTNTLMGIARKKIKTEVREFLKLGSWSEKEDTEQTWRHWEMKLENKTPKYILKDKKFKEMIQKLPIREEEEYFVITFEFKANKYERAQYVLEQPTHNLTIPVTTEIGISKNLEGMIIQKFEIE